MKTITNILLVILLSFPLLTGCSSENEKEPEPGSIEAQMEQVGHEAAEEIKSSLQKAEDVGQLQTDHYKKLEQELEEQQ